MAKQASVARIKTETPRGVVLGADISAAASLPPTGAYEARQWAAKRARLFDTHAKSCSGQAESTQASSHLRRGSIKTASSAARFFMIVALTLTLSALASPQASAQGSRRDDIVFGPTGHPIAGAANTFAGSVALASGTATVTFPTAYNSAPVCTANDTSAIATVRVQTTATTLTLTQSLGTDTIAYICVGNPN
jgi:hypothetical protein